MFESCENRAVERADPPTRTETAACARRLPPRLARPSKGTASGAPPHSPPGGGVAICLGGGSDVPPKQRGEVTVVGVADPSADLVEGERSPRQQVLRTLHPAPDDVLVRRLPGSLLEQVRKVRRACLRHSGELDEGQRVLQMRLNIGGRALQLGQGEPAVERRIEVPAEGVHDVRCSCGPLPLTPNDIVDNGSTA
jgi:hypothetical protein